jgi:hypothetical protein
MRVRNGKITEHWGVANLFSLGQPLLSHAATRRLAGQARSFLVPPSLHSMLAPERNIR